LKSQRKKENPMERKKKRRDGKFCVASGTGKSASNRGISFPKKEGGAAGCVRPQKNTGDQKKKKGKAWAALGKKEEGKKNRLRNAREERGGSFVTQEEKKKLSP